MIFKVWQNSIIRASHCVRSAAGIQFESLAMAQLSGRQSPRDIEANMNAQTGSRYQLGVSRIAKSSLARVNENHPHTLDEALFEKLAPRCASYSPRHKLRFKNPLYSLDSSLIELSLARKYQSAHLSLSWQYLLPSTRLRVDPGIGCRHSHRAGAARSSGCQNN